MKKLTQSDVQLWLGDNPAEWLSVLTEIINGDYCPKMAADDCRATIQE